MRRGSDGKGSTTSGDWGVVERMVSSSQTVGPEPPHSGPTVVGASGKPEDLPALVRLLCSE